jgi:hypothetical protein
MWPIGLIRKWCRRCREPAERRLLDNQYEEGYCRLPEDALLAGAQASMSAQILDQW